MTTDNDYIYYNDFEDVSIPTGLLPKDVKRIIKHNANTYNNRKYFLSSSEKMIYRYFPKNEYAEPLKPFILNNGTIRFQLIPDADECDGKTPQKRDSIYFTNRFQNKISKMSKIII